MSTSYLRDLDGNVVGERDGGCGSSCWLRGYVYFGGRLVAVYEGNTTFFVHGDHLGSTRLMTDMSETVCYAQDYLPLGESNGSSGACSTTHLFTGKERDSETGLDNFGARYMSSQYGRFMTPDPMGGQLANPQSLNRYAYVRNNPMSLVDPAGMNPDSPGAGDCEEVGFCDAIAEGDWGFGPGYNGPTTTATMNFEGGGYCGASSSGCGGFGGNGGNASEPDFGPFGIQFYDANGLPYPGIFDSWGDYTNWSTYVTAKSIEESNEIGQYDKLKGNLDKQFNGNVALNDWWTGILQGGHYNWGYQCGVGPCPTTNTRYKNGVHDSEIGLLHNDTWSPWTGPFELSYVFRANFWKHAFVDVFGGEIGAPFGFVFPF